MNEESDMVLGPKDNCFLVNGCMLKNYKGERKITKIKAWELNGVVVLLDFFLEGESACSSQIKDHFIGITNPPKEIQLYPNEEILSISVSYLTYITEIQFELPMRSFKLGYRQEGNYLKTFCLNNKSIRQIEYGLSEGGINYFKVVYHQLSSSPNFKDQKNKMNPNYNSPPFLGVAQNPLPHNAKLNFNYLVQNQKNDFQQDFSNQNKMIEYQRGYKNLANPNLPGHEVEGKGKRLESGAIDLGGGAIQNVNPQKQFNQGGNINPVNLPHPNMYGGNMNPQKFNVQKSPIVDNAGKKPGPVDLGGGAIQNVNQQKQFNQGGNINPVNLPHPNMYEGNMNPQNFNQQKSPYVGYAMKKPGAIDLGGGNFNLNKNYKPSILHYKINMPYSESSSKSVHNLNLNAMLPKDMLIQYGETNFNIIEYQLPPNYNYQMNPILEYPILKELGKFQTINSLKQNDYYNFILPELQNKGKSWNIKTITILSNRNYIHGIVIEYTMGIYDQSGQIIVSRHIGKSMKIFMIREQLELAPNEFIKEIVGSCDGQIINSLGIKTSLGRQIYNNCKHSKENFYCKAPNDCKIIAFETYLGYYLEHLTPFMLKIK